MKILIAYDGSMSSDVAIDDLLRAGLPDDVECQVLAVAEGQTPQLTMHGPFDRELVQRWQADFDRAASLAEGGALRTGKTFPRWKVSAESCWGGAARMIVDRAEKWGADLVVMGSHGHSLLGRMLIGSVSHQVVTACHRSVRVARPRAASDSMASRIAIGVDGSEHSRLAVAQVAGRRWPKGTVVRLISVIEVEAPANFMGLPAQAGGLIAEMTERQRLSLEETIKTLRGTLDTAGLAVEDAIILGNPRHALLEETERWKADAIFVGARGVGRLSRLLLGSVSSSIVTRAHCTVEVVRS